MAFRNSCRSVLGMLLCLTVVACSQGRTRAVSTTPLPAGPLRIDGHNPRYFTDTAGKIVYLVGAHTWRNLQDFRSEREALFDYSSYIRFLKRHQLNFFRLWRQEEALWFPLPYLRTGPGVAFDGRPKFDLDQMDPVFFDRLAARVDEAREQGIYVAVMLFQGWSVERKSPGRAENPWDFHPFHRANNVNGVDGDRDGNGEGSETHEMQDAAVTERQDRYVRQVIDTVNRFDNVLYEIANESTPGSVPWQEHVVQVIHDYEAAKPKQHPVLFSAPWHSREADLWTSKAEAVSPTLPAPYAADYAYRDDPPANDGRKVIINDTDHLWGVGGTEDWVWKSFVRGLNPIYMDPYDPATYARYYKQVHETRAPVLQALGETKRYADRIPLRTMIPHGELCSSRYCLVDPGQSYLVYLPAHDTSGKPASVELELEHSSGEFWLEWFNPGLDRAQPEQTLHLSGRVTLTAPFTGPAVLYMSRISQ